MKNDAHVTISDWLAERDQEITAQYENGATVEQLAKRWRLSRRQIYRILGDQDADLRGWG
jgi:Mor family transcriptional regulator